MGGPLRGFAIARPRPGPPVGSGLGVAVAWPGVAPPPPRGRLAVRRGSARAVGALAWCALRPVLPRVPRRPPAALPPRCCGSPPRRPSPSFPSAWRSAALRRAGLRFACPAGGSAACGRRARGPPCLAIRRGPACGLALAPSVPGRGPFRAVCKADSALSRALKNPVDSTSRRGGGGFQPKNRPFLLEIFRNVVHFADCRRRGGRGTLIVQTAVAARSIWFITWETGL